MTYLHPTISIKSGSSSAEMEVDARSLAKRMCHETDEKHFYSVTVTNSLTGIKISNPENIQVEHKQIDVYRIIASIGTTSAGYEIKEWQIGKRFTGTGLVIGVPFDSMSPPSVAKIASESSINSGVPLWRGYLQSSPATAASGATIFEFDFIKLFGKPYSLGMLYEPEGIVFTPISAMILPSYTYNLVWAEFAVPARP